LTDYGEDINNDGDTIKVVVPRTTVGYDTNTTPTYSDDDWARFYAMADAQYPHLKSLLATGLSAGGAEQMWGGGQRGLSTLTATAMGALGQPSSYKDLLGKTYGDLWDDVSGRAGGEVASDVVGDNAVASRAAQNYFNLRPDITATANALNQAISSLMGGIGKGISFSGAGVGQHITGLQPTITRSTDVAKQLRGENAPLSDLINTSKAGVSPSNLAASQPRTMEAAVAPWQNNSQALGRLLNTGGIADLKGFDPNNTRNLNTTIYAGQSVSDPSRTKALDKLVGDIGGTTTPLTQGTAIAPVKEGGFAFDQANQQRTTIKNLIDSTSKGIRQDELTTLRDVNTNAGYGSDKYKSYGELANKGVGGMLSEIESRAMGNVSSVQGRSEDSQLALARRAATDAVRGMGSNFASRGISGSNVALGLASREASRTAKDAIDKIMMQRSNNQQQATQDYMGFSRDLADRSIQEGRLEFDTTSQNVQSELAKQVQAAQLQSQSRIASMGAAQNLLDTNTQQAMGIRQQDIDVATENANLEFQRKSALVDAQLKAGEISMAQADSLLKEMNRQQEENITNNLSALAQQRQLEASKATFVDTTRFDATKAGVDALLGTAGIQQEQAAGMASAELGASDLNQRRAQAIDQLNLDAQQLRQWGLTSAAELKEKQAADLASVDLETLKSAFSQTQERAGMTEDARQFNEGAAKDTALSAANLDLQRQTAGVNALSDAQRAALSASLEEASIAQGASESTANRVAQYKVENTGQAIDYAKALASGDISQASLMEEVRGGRMKTALDTIVTGLQSALDREGIDQKTRDQINTVIGMVGDYESNDKQVKLTVATLREQGLQDAADRIEERNALILKSAIEFLGTGAGEKASGWLGGLIKSGLNWAGDKLGLGDDEEETPSAPSVDAGETTGTKTSSNRQILDKPADSTTVVTPAPAAPAINNATTNTAAQIPPLNEMGRNDAIALQSAQNTVTPAAPSIPASVPLQPLTQQEAGAIYAQTGDIRAVALEAKKRNDAIALNNAQTSLPTPATPIVPAAPVAPAAPASSGTPFTTKAGTSGPSTQSILERVFTEANATNINQSDPRWGDFINQINAFSKAVGYGNGTKYPHPEFDAWVENTYNGLKTALVSKPATSPAVTPAATAVPLPRPQGMLSDVEMTSINEQGGLTALVAAIQQRNAQINTPVPPVAPAAPAVPLQPLTQQEAGAIYAQTGDIRAVALEAKKRNDAIALQSAQNTVVPVSPVAPAAPVMPVIPAADPLQSLTDAGRNERNAAIAALADQKARMSAQATVVANATTNPVVPETPQQVADKKNAAGYPQLRSFFNSAKDGVGMSFKDAVNGLSNSLSLITDAYDLQPALAIAVNEVYQANKRGEIREDEMAQAFFRHPAIIAFKRRAGVA